MYNTTERLLFYLLGCAVGAVTGFAITHFCRVSPVHHEALHIQIIAVLSGLIAAMIVAEYRHEHRLRRNSKIRQEVTTLLTHEMRTGLTSTSWAIEMILEKYEDKLTAGDIQLLKSITNSIHATVMHSVNLLDVSRLDEGKLSISFERITLDKVDHLFKEIVEKYRLGATKKDIILTSDILLDPKKEAQLDMLRLRIILENLLENAIQYTVLNKKEIAVSIVNTDTTLNISVSDTGIGIPDAEKGNIYKEFFRASNARKNLTNGSGIGLYTCFEYAKAHGGSIHFDSHENVGTTFHVSIPLKQKQS